MTTAHQRDLQRTHRKATEKITAVVEALATESRVSSVARTVDLPVSTVHRILQELVAVGWARPDGEHGYTLGARLLSTAGQASNEGMLTRVTRPVLRELCDATTHAAHFGMRQGDEAVYLAKMEGRRSYQMRSRVGLAIPLHCTAIGKAILAALPEEEVRSIAARTGLPARTEHTITDVDELLAHLTTVKRRGFAYDEEENEPHIRCVAAVVIDHRGVAVGGVSVSSLAFDIDRARLLRHAALVVSAARQISAALGVNAT